MGIRVQIYEDDCGGISGFGISIGDGLSYYWEKRLIVFCIFAKYNFAFHQFEFTLSDQVLSQNPEITLLSNDTGFGIEALLYRISTTVILSLPVVSISGNNNFGEITH